MFKPKQHHLDHLLSPRSVAVVGASREKEKIGAIVLKNILDGKFFGTIYPINPAGGKIQKLHAYKNYSDTPTIPDLAIVAVPAPIVPHVLEEIGRKGTKHVVILSAGFKEMGGAGIAAEKQLVSLAQKYHLNILGPNCLGFLNSKIKLNATFGKASLLPGNLRFISQSGAIATSFFDWADQVGLGFEQFITLGNKATITENDILENWKSHIVPSKKHIDTQQKSGLSSYQPIGLYLESISQGKKFLKHLNHISLTNPIFILKPGKSSGAQKAMMSHTGSIAGNDAVLEVALKETGVIRCHGMEDLFDLAKAFAFENAPKTSSVAVISNAGGPGVMSADLLAEAGLHIAELSKKTQEILQKNLPAAANIHDPIDVLGDALAERYAVAINAVLADSNVSALVVLLTPQMTTQIKQTAQIISVASAKFGKPIVTAFIGGSQITEGAAVLHAHKIPCYLYPDRAIWVLGKMFEWQNWRQKQKKISKVSVSTIHIPSSAEKMLSSFFNSKNSVLTPLQSDRLLDASTLLTPVCMPLQSLESAHKFLSKHKKIVLKISSSKLLHKTELHGVFTNIDSPKKLNESWKKISHGIQKIRRSDAQAEILAQTHIDDGLELIVGVKTDSNFGKILLFGAGGIMVEILGDKNLHTLPMTEIEIRNLLETSKIFPLLKGYRGQKPYAIKKLVQTVSKLISLALSPEIREIEINPLIITHTDVFAVDGKVLLSNEANKKEL